MKTSEIKNKIDGLTSQRKRYLDAIGHFEKLYGEQDIEIYSAPGRTEIGGNHTDHQNGKVLAAAIDLDAIAVVSKVEENVIHIKSEGYPAITVDLAQLEPIENEKGTTNALVRGVASGVAERGYKIGGFQAYITSEVMSGSGLSSSAAFEVLVGTIFSGLYNSESIAPVTIAKIGQEAERKYFGKPCGLMDQMACAVGGMVYIDFGHEQGIDVKKLDVDFSQFEHSLCIVDTKGSHADLTDDYAAVPEEMKRVANCFGKELLCEVNKSSFYQELSNIREKTGDRAVLRAIHWFQENERVEREVNALEASDFEGFKATVRESGDSSFKFLQNVFSVKTPALQSLSLALALSELYLGNKGVCRVHGGGFAGTIQAFVPNDMVEGYKKYMEKYFGEDSCHILQIRSEGGKKVI